MICKKCGYQNSDGGNFCTKCGVKLVETPTEPLNDETELANSIVDIKSGNTGFMTNNDYSAKSAKNYTIAELCHILKPAETLNNEPEIANEVENIVITDNKHLAKNGDDAETLIDEPKIDNEAENIVTADNNYLAKNDDDVIPTLDELTNPSTLINNSKDNTYLRYAILGMILGASGYILYCICNVTLKGKK